LRLPLGYFIAAALATAGGLAGSAHPLQVHHNRTKLLYNHIPKCGGKYAIQQLRKVLPDDGTFLVKVEALSSNRSDRTTAFVVASIREPCSYYHSLYSFGRQGQGAFHKMWLRKYKGHPLARLYDGANFNVSKFESWMAVVAGEYSRRVAASVPDMAVDCWVRTSHAEEDLQRCLAQYAAQGGRVEHKYSVGELVHSASHGLLGEGIVSPPDANARRASFPMP
jgi:hypothetical protein